MPSRITGTTNMPAGYSGTPLARKLGIKEGSIVLAIDAPDEYVSMLEPLPSGVSFETIANHDVDLAHLYVKRKSDLQQQLEHLRRNLRVDAVIWVSWPKRSSKVSTDITEDTIREVALPMGFVDIKVCAVNEIWSGLKIVVRKELR